MPIALGGRRQRAVLTVLLLHVNEFVSADRLVEEAWSGRPPPGAAGTLQTYISRLRRLLSATDASLTTVGDGYQLCVDPGDYDVTCFRRLTAEGRVALRAGNPQGACELLESALSLWQGEPLADLADEDFAVDAIRDLDEERLAAEIDLVDAGLELGWADVAFIGDIRRLVDRYPHDERIRERLMLALYRSGRQAEALEAYRDTRAVLLNDFGIDPSERLRMLERAILRQDPMLDAHGAQIRDHAVGDPPIPWESRVAGRLGRRRLAGAVAAAAVIVAASITLVGIRLTGGTGSIGWRSCCAEAALIGSSNGDVESSLSLKSAPTAAVAKHGVLWVTSSSSGLVDRIDMQDHGLTRVAVGGSPAGVAISHGLVWVADSSGRDLLRISPKSEHVVGHIDVCNGPVGVTAGLGDLWVACPLDGMVVEIDPATNTIERRITLGPTPTDLAVAAGDVWVTLESAGEVARYDPRTRTVAPIAVGQGPSTIVAGDGDLWVADTVNRAVARVQASSGIVESVTPVGSAPEALAAAAGGVWSAEPNAARLELLSGRPAKVTRVVRTPNPVVALTDDGGQVAAAATLPVARRRGGTVRFAVSEPLPPRPDPAVSFNTTALEIEVVTNDGLLAFRRTSGALGEVLVPDLADALPEMSDSGRVWSMTLRNGLRYSTGHPIRAADIRYGLERAFEAGAPTLPLYEDIVGAPECKPHDPCNLSRGIVVHGQTITFRLSRPDADFPDKLALPFADAVPVGWPAPPSKPEGTVGVVPATGPYLIHSYTPGRSLILTRNPDFHQWSADAQPAGYPNQIVEEAESGVTGLERAILRHRVDIAVLDRRSLLSWARARYPGEVDEDADPASAWEAVNTRRAPFDDVRVRQALAYAVDRAMAAATDVGARPSCQILPPAFPGYAPYCKYSAPAGQRWARPDLARARQLIKAAGAQGSRVRVIVVRKYVNNTRVIAKALRALRLRGTFATVSLKEAIRLVARAPARFNLVATGSAADYPSPSDYFDELFTCKSFVPHTTANRNLSEFCSPRIDGMIARATRLELVSSARANRMWTNVDHAVSRQAPVIPLYSYGVATWLSPRLRDYMYSPFAGALLDQLWRASPDR